MSSWLPYVVLTVLSWGTYIPTLHKGQAGLAGSGVHAFLMVGVAYVLVAIAVPGIMVARAGSWHVFTPSGVAFTVGAGVLGALGALGIVLALVNGGRRTSCRRSYSPGRPWSACSWRCSTTHRAKARRRCSSSGS